MVGYNFRLGEIECAIGIEQLKKLEGFVLSRQSAAEQLTSGLMDLKGLRTPIVKSGCTHSYYMYPLVLDLEIINVPRKQIIRALEAEGVMGLAAGYTNIHLLPMYQQKIAFGSKGFPWTSDICHRDVNYEKGICPVAERLHDSSYFGIEMCMFELNENDVDLIISAFHKVWSNLTKLG